MKKEGHPDYHPITIVLTTGEEYASRSTYGKSGARLTPHMDRYSWDESNAENQNRKQIGRVGRYKKRYGWMSGEQQ